ncbi:ABC transporter substrate-binding protein [Vallitalea longa]|uniref:ABC transporter substrate-binding protein n=1 Tax=Vallitalea longa TaxID=2936439 RepID=UPI002492BB80|nr:extracellular solute-binding protein [Vallitalea longa]
MLRYQSNKDPLIKDSKIKDSILIWGWDESLNKSFSEYSKKNNVSIKYELIDSNDYLRILQSSLAVNKKIPDIVFMERDQISDLIDLGLCEDLGKKPFNILSEDFLHYNIDNYKDKDNNIIGIPYDIAISALAYRSDLTEKYFNVKDRKLVEDKLYSWDILFENALEVKNRSKEDIKLFPSIRDYAVMVINQYDKKLIENDKLNCKEYVEDIFGDCIFLRDNELVYPICQWSPEWYYYIDYGNSIFLPCPPWFLHYVIENMENKNIHYNIMMPPEGGFIWGGTAWGISKQSNHKEEAFKLLKWLLLSEEGAYHNINDYRLLTHYAHSYNEDKFIYSKKLIFENQAMGEIYMREIYNNMKVRPISEYETKFNCAFDYTLECILKHEANNSKEAMEIFISKIKNLIPELID